MYSELVVNSKHKSGISEDIKTIRTNLAHSKDNTQCILITSANPGEGKSFVSANLAAAFAQNGEKVLLIDCDLRLGRTHDIFKLPNDIGFSNILSSSGDVKFSTCIKSTKIEGLSIITRGDTPTNPSELLSSSLAKKALDILKEKYDRIILDGVPVNGLPDSLIVSNLVDKVVLVTSVGVSSIDELMDAKKALVRVDADIAGVVVNKVTRPKKNKYNSYYR